jgi:hypothetical protein
MRTGSHKLSPAGIEPTFNATLSQNFNPLVKNTLLNTFDSSRGLTMV